MISKFLNSYISKIKGESYTLDPSIPAGYLITATLSQIFMKVRGKLLFPLRAHSPFIASNVRLVVRSKIIFGKGVIFHTNCSLNALSRDGIVLGNNVSVGTNTKIECTGNLKTLGKGLSAGNNVGLGSDNFYGCAGGIVIGDDTIVGNFVSFHSENHNYDRSDVPIRLQGVNHSGINVGSNCWIGAKSTILDGAVIHNGCIIAAGAVVRAGVYAANGIYGGVPAKLLKMRGGD